MRTIKSTNDCYKFHRLIHTSSFHSSNLHPMSISLIIHPQIPQTPSITVTVEIKNTFANFPYINRRQKEKNKANKAKNKLHYISSASMVVVN